MSWEVLCLALPSLPLWETGRNMTSLENTKKESRVHGGIRAVSGGSPAAVLATPLFPPNSVLPLLDFPKARVPPVTDVGSVSSSSSSSPRPTGLFGTPLFSGIFLAQLFLNFDRFCKAVCLGRFDAQFLHFFRCGKLLVIGLL